MNPEAYTRLTQELRERLEADPRVLGLVALGSMAQQDYQPDRWSDHDFFVIVEFEPEAFRSNFTWLPEPERIALAFRETAHGVKVVYEGGHLLEFAVFDQQELNLARVNRYRVLLDRGGIEEALEQIARETRQQIQRNRDGDELLFGQFLTNLLVGAGRHARGERISGRVFIKNYALRHLLVLLERHLSSPRQAVLDNLDPFRRFEVAFPELGRELNRILDLPTLQAAVELLGLAQRELHGLADYPVGGAETVLEALLEIQRGEDAT